MIFRNITVKYTRLFLCILTRVSKTSTNSSLELMCVRAQSLQSCLTLCHPMDCSPPGSSVHEVGCHALLQGIFQTQGLNYSFLSLTLASRILTTREALRHLTGWELKEYKLPLWASLVVQTGRIRLQCERPGFNPCIGKIPWRRAWQPTPVFWPGESLLTEEPSRL